MKTICKIVVGIMLGIMLFTLVVVAGVCYFEFILWLLPKIGV